MNIYLLIKSLHLISVISWMAGLLYLPRIFVYHVENSEKKDITDTFEIMERKLYFYIMRPAMLLSWLFGIILVAIIGFNEFTSLWLQIKFILVLLLSIYNEYLGRCLKSLKEKTNKKSSKFFRIINEVPTILLILIVFIVIFKPL